MTTLFSIQTDGCGNLYAMDDEGNILTQAHMVDESDFEYVAVQLCKTAARVLDF